MDRREFLKLVFAVISFLIAPFQFSAKPEITPPTMAIDYGVAHNRVVARMTNGEIYECEILVDY